MRSTPYSSQAINVRRNLSYLRKGRCVLATIKAVLSSTISVGMAWHRGLWDKRIQVHGHGSLAKNFDHLKISKAG